MELFGLIFVFYDNKRLIIGSSFKFEWPELHILLDNWIGELSTDESLSIEDSVSWVLSGLILSSISDKSFGLCEADI